MDNNNVDMFSETRRKKVKIDHNNDVIKQQEALLNLNEQMLNKPGVSKELKAVAKKYLEQMRQSIETLKEESHQFTNPCQ